MLYLPPVTQLAVYSTLALTMGLVATRPRLGAYGRLSPALIGSVAVLLLSLMGVVGLGDVWAAASELWRAFATIASLMVLAEVSRRVGLLAWAAGRIEARTRSTRSLFIAVFALGACSATALNNDAAILLLTPLVLALVGRMYPGRSDLMVPFAFAVFASAGVAPLMVSNPMNAIVAEMAGIGFVQYSAVMVPVAAVGWLVSLAMLLLIFRRALAAPRAHTTAPASQSTPAQKRLLALLGAVLVSYAVVGWVGGPVWSVAAVGAVMALVIGGSDLGAPRYQVLRDGVSWDTLGFLLAVLVLAAGLHSIGFVDLLAAQYAGAGVAEVGVTSALGSAMLNNHPMAVLNVMALDGAGGDTSHVLAALIGGDLGPRLLPAGSLAGLLWLELLRRRGVDLGVRQFVTIGVLLTVPTLFASLAVLAAL